MAGKGAVAKDDDFGKGERSRIATSTGAPTPSCVETYACSCSIHFYGHDTSSNEVMERKHCR